MATRKELMERLESGLERLTEAERDSTDALERYSYSHETIADSMERAAEVNSSAVIKASENIGKAANNIVGGLFLGLIGLAVYKAVEILAERVEELNKKTDMINAVIKLQKKYPHLSYSFIIERAYVAGSDSEERKTLLNELIDDEIVTSHIQIGGKEIFVINVDNPALKAHWQLVDSIPALRHVP
jgi:hypothetical protein